MAVDRKRHRCCYCGFVSDRLVSCDGVAPIKNYRSRFMCEFATACQRRIDVLERREREKIDGR